MNEVDRPSWLVTIAYDGGAYSGWQIQPGTATIQRVIEEKLSTLFRGEVNVAACSRTDAGVHALSQKASFSPPELPLIDPSTAKRALNSLLPPDVRIRSIVEKTSDFHARHNTKGKAYSYLLYVGESLSPFARDYYWTLGSEPNLQAMTESAKYLTGTHDFTGFTVKSGNQNCDSVKTLKKVIIRRTGNFIIITIIGNSFLYKMVRRLVGFLLKVGKEQFRPEITEHVLKCEERLVQFDTAPPHGLYLEEVFYSKAEMARYQPGQLPFLQLLGLPNLEELAQTLKVWPQNNT